MNKPTAQELMKEHDDLYLKGQHAYELSQELGIKVLELRERINKEFPGDYDEVHLLFNGTFDNE